MEIVPYIRDLTLKDINVRTKTIKILEKNTSRNVSDTGCNSFFLGMSPKARKTKAKINYWDYIKIKSFCTAKKKKKKKINKSKRQPIKWEKIFTNDISNKGLVSKIYKEFIKLNTQKANNPIKRWTEDMNEQTFIQRKHPYGQQTHEKMLNISHHQGNANQTTVSYHFTPVKMSKIKRLKYWRGIRENGALKHCW